MPPGFTLKILADGQALAKTVKAGYNIVKELARREKEHAGIFLLLFRDWLSIIA